ncbi:MAG: O-antigen ligase family protein [Chloroflexi bacterium]|nr:O-antigen ligase family protein [Chloroflexota bacterium]
MANHLDLLPPTPPSKSRPISFLVASAGILISLTGGLFISGYASLTQVALVVFGLLTFFLTFSRLEFGVAAMIFILYTQTYLIVGQRYGLTDLAQGLIMLLGLAMVTRWAVYTNEIPQGWMRPLLLVTFYCVVGLASVMYALKPALAAPVAIETIKSGIIALIIAATLKNEGSFRLALWSLLIAGIFLGTLSVIQFTFGTYDNDYGGYAIASVQNISGATNDYRLGGPVGDPNFYAQMMLVLVPIALDRLWDEKQAILRFLAGWALTVCSFTVLLTYSRGGFVSMVIVVVAMLAIFHRGQLRYLMAAMTISILLFSVLPSRFTERIGTLSEFLPGASQSADGVSSDYSIRGRTSEMIVALEMFGDHPILGVGLGNYPAYYQQYSQRLGLDLRAEARQAHSLYLEVAAETGLLGLFSFGLLLWVILRSAWRAVRALAANGLVPTANMVAAFVFGFCGHLFASLFIHSVYPRNFWLLAGIALSAARMTEVEIGAAEKVREKVQSNWRSPTLPEPS